MSYERNIEYSNWYSPLEKNPDSDGIYYVFTSNCMDNSNDIRKLEYKKDKWHKLNDKYIKILAWKNIPERLLINETKWLKEHINEIRKAFHNNEMNYEDCCIAETLDECLCEYEEFLWDNRVCFIDNIFVIRII